MAEEHPVEWVRNPVEWTGNQLAHAAHALGAAGHSLHHIQETLHSPAPAVWKIRTQDVWDVLAKGFKDFGAFRTDVIFICAVYPVVGLLLGKLTFGYHALPLLFPLISGFALIGPVACVGLYEMSRQHERGNRVTFATSFGVFRAPAIGAIVMLGLLLTTIFLLWMVAAWEIYRVTLGPEFPTSVSAFVRDIFTTPAGLTMVVVGVSVGFLFALAAMAISTVSFPLLLDRDVGLDTAIRTSVRAVAANPVPMALWGMIVAGGLVIGSIPLFLGLIVVVPVLGHATWHLYRKLVPR